MQTRQPSISHGVGMGTYSFAACALAVARAGATGAGLTRDQIAAEVALVLDGRGGDKGCQESSGDIGETHGG